MTEKKKKRKGERSDGLIQVSLQIGFKDDGRPERKYFYGHTRAEAERKRDEYKAQQQIRSMIDKDITVDEWVEIFKKTYREGVNPVYLVNDDAPYNRLVKEIGRMKVADVRETDLQHALNKTAGMSSSTVSKYISTIKRVFRKAKKNRIIDDDPSEDLKRPTSTKGSHRALERWEIDLILEHWHDEGVRGGLWVMLMLLCGLRRSEVIALRWENIDLQTRSLRVAEVAVTVGNKTIIEKRAKSDAGLRVLPICNVLLNALNTVPPSERHGLVCTSAKGELLTESSFRWAFGLFVTSMERILNGEEPIQQGRRNDLIRKQNRLDLEKADKEWKHVSFRAHDLRHSFATALYDAGVPVKAAQYFLGHSDIKITLDLYTHLSKERKAASNLQMVSYLDSWVEMRGLEAVRIAAFEGDEEQ